MDAALFEPWMIRSDWREACPPLFVVDLAAWPAGLPLDPLPPVPLIGIGAVDHPLAHMVDALVEAEIPLAAYERAVLARPRTAAAIVQLLRSIEGVEARAALTMESMAFAMLQGGEEHADWLAGQGASAPLPPGAVSASRQGATLALELVRPEARNSIDHTMRDALFDAFTLAALDETVERVVLTGRGRAFSMGADLGEFGTTRDPVEAHAIRMRTLPARALVAAERRCVIEARIQGGCVGSGLELAAFAGRITAAPDAWFQLPELAMGILPGAGGCVSVPRRIGRQRAAALILSGRRITARTALQWGLVDSIVDEPAADDGHPDEAGV